MLDSFTQLFSLPDELVAMKVIKCLCWKEISLLDVAINNKSAHKHFLCWVRNTRIIYQYNSQTVHQFVSWVKRLGIIVNWWCMERDAEDAALQPAKLHDLRVDHFEQFSCSRVSWHFTMDFLASLNTLKSIAVWLSRKDNDASSAAEIQISKWEAALKNNPKLTAITVCDSSDLASSDIATQLTHRIAMHCPHLRRWISIFIVQ